MLVSVVLVWTVRGLPNLGGVGLGGIEVVAQTVPAGGIPVVECGVRNLDTLVSIGVSVEAFFIAALKV